MLQFWLVCSTCAKFDCHFKKKVFITLFFNVSSFAFSMTVLSNWQYCYRNLEFTSMVIGSHLDTVGLPNHTKHKILKNVDLIIVSVFSHHRTGFRWINEKCFFKMDDFLFWNETLQMQKSTTCKHRSFKPHRHNPCQTKHLLWCQCNHYGLFTEYVNISYSSQVHKTYIH